MIYNTWAISNNDTIIIKSEMTKYQLLDQVFNILNDVSVNNDDDKLTVDVTIITNESRHMTQAGKRYCDNKGLKHIIDNYDSQFSNYSLFVINILNHIYIICPGSF